MRTALFVPTSIGAARAVAGPLEQRVEQELLRLGGPRHEALGSCRRPAGPTTKATSGSRK